ncbi:hypothetical protein [Microvirga sp. CF3016]|uniref:hypothetical protein n=1 Tax=Microvirga sp. CF3016 TaxID=3110181 RepID=UPI002E76B37D|nr:hypothetical protein [Microvirga sp. CF3016]MEE1609712.1 hypothetical protein [Microvirga sp. CF3016]
MKSINLAVAAAIFLLGGCVSAARIPDEKNPAMFYGEASYFASRCPRLQQHRFLDTAFTYCLSNKIYAGGCDKSMTENFFADQARGEARARGEFASTSDEQVCRVAQERFGPNGSRFAKVLLPRKK